jgi:hypothetical protein
MEAKESTASRWVEMLIDMGDHLKTFTIKTTFFHEEI